MLTAVVLILAQTAPDESALRAEVSPKELERHAAEIVRHVRPSGSEGEFRAIDYIVKTLRSEAIPVELYELEGFVSDPVRASVRVEGETAEILALTQVFSASTGPGGVSGEVVDGLRNARGRIAILDGLADPDGLRSAGEAGALGAIFVAGSDRLNEMTVGPIWGTPSLAEEAELPRIPSVAIKKSDGEALRRRLQAGSLRVRVVTEVATGWKKLRLPVASIRSASDAEGYVLLGVHIDAWHHGGTDEGASNAAMLEIARILYRHRSELQRGLKVAWWPGHSNGRYAGSTW